MKNSFHKQWIKVIDTFNVANVAKGKCLCPGAWTGEKCEIGPCESSPCFQQVQCNISSDGLNFTCGPCPILNGTIFTGDGVRCFRKFLITLIVMFKSDYICVRELFLNFLFYCMITLFLTCFSSWSLLKWQFPMPIYGFMQDGL